MSQVVFLTPNFTYKFKHVLLKKDAVRDVKTYPVYFYCTKIENT